ncbi:hypothetical protein MD588_03865 [Photobacterium sp. SDRW27]|uniref:hypothetical protein n=1 Tax=Photobacterium obscurum TaxID=2829490 RepID=UPI002242CC15|nr:hypothetical protein [Photobacterium obscurum]MCW8327935.1 hypothetical protein [Photobacterium obscurum]
MQLQQNISKFVMLIMLFTVFSSPVNAASLNGTNTPSTMGCHTTVVMSCCDSVTQPALCGPEQLETQTHTTNCCSENDCHANSAQFAILSEFKFLSVPTAVQIFTEPEGERHFYNDVLLRPPVSA